jgi:predicted RNA-binding protein with PUA-like domain
MPRYWLVKSEPSVYSIDDLTRDGQTHWDGVRNYQARNFLRDEMQVGDLVLFYHSNTDPPSVVGLAQVTRAGYPDHTALDPHDPHYDPKATLEKPIWAMTDIKFVEKFPHSVSLNVLRDDPALGGLALTRRGSRLSVLPVTEAHFQRIYALSH